MIQINYRLGGVGSDRNFFNLLLGFQLKITKKVIGEHKMIKYQDRHVNGLHVAWNYGTNPERCLLILSQFFWFVFCLAFSKRVLKTK